MVYGSKEENHKSLSNNKNGYISETVQIFKVKKAFLLLHSIKNFQGISFYFHITDPTGNHRDH